MNLSSDLFGQKFFTNTYSRLLWDVDPDSRFMVNSDSDAYHKFGTEKPNSKFAKLLKATLKYQSS